MTGTIHCVPQMPARLSIALVLILSLLFGAQAQPVPAAVKTPGCAMTQCVRGCCPSMVCCAGQEKDAPQPAPMPSPQRGGPDFAAIGLFTNLFLYVLPPVEAKLTAAQDAAIPHARPRRAVSCIFLI